MPPRTRKRKSSSEDDPETREPTSKRVTERAPRNPPVKKPNPRQTSKNAIRTESVNRWTLLDTSNTPKKRRLKLEDAKRQIRLKGEDLVSFIEQQLSEELQPFNEAAVLTEIPPDLFPILSWSTASGADGTAAVPYSPHKEMAETLKQLRRFVDDYDGVNKKNTGFSEPTWMRWKQDIKDLWELNSHAMSAAAAAVHSAILPTPQSPSSSKASENASDVEKVAWELLEEGQPDPSEETWGTLAFAQVRTFSSLLKLLSDLEKA